ncbi:MAG: hypothetical protein OEV49_13035 [candidate division Zixibacteria bacterium]|nr:hypothetical protein [candidate division Zixibacteria bacterium]MDH3938916.1 hypothetical protein [candidate division Zixibacteria bacterium]MDH4034108.1 hypothetical protein [candidate division Zixibacteria bacterium]
MKLWSILLMLILLLTINSTLLAQDEDEARDLLEICVYGGVGSPMGNLSDWHDSLGAKLGWSLGVDFGYFMMPSLVVGFNFQYTQFGIDGPAEVDGAHHRLYNPNLFAKYYFSGESDFEPYIKGHVGIENPKFTTLLTGPKYRSVSYDASLAAGFGVGLFYYRTDYSGLFIEANYNYAATKDAQRVYAEETLDFVEDISVFDIHAGVRLLIGSGE